MSELNIMDPNGTFNSIISEDGSYVYDSIELDPELELYDDIANEAISLYTFYINRANDYIIEETNNVDTINKLQDFIMTCIAEKSKISTIYESNKLGYEKAIIDTEYTTPIDNKNTISEVSIIDEDGNEFFYNVDNIIEEDSKYDSTLKKYLYKERLLTNKDVMDLYEKKKDILPSNIKLFYPTLKQYNKNNIFIDLDTYFNVFIKKLKIKSPERRLEMYYEFFLRLVDDKQYREAGYDNIYLLLTLNHNGDLSNMKTYLDYKVNLNPISMIYRYLKTNITKFKEDFKGKKIVFYDPYAGSFLMEVDKLQPGEEGLFLSNIRMANRNYNKTIEPGKTLISADKDMSDKLKILFAVDKIEKKNNIKINNLTGTRNMDREEFDKLTNSQNDAELSKALVIDDLEKNAVKAKDDKELADKIEADDFLASKIDDIKVADSENVKISAARASRIAALNSKFAKSKLDNGLTVAEKIASSNNKDELPEKNIPVDSINDEWHHLTSASFDESYDLQADVLGIIMGFGDPDRISKPVSVVEWNVEDASTSEDYINTYSFKLETITARRFTLRFDMPKLINHRFMKLRGNEKTISNQLVLFPIIKTEPDTVQIVSNYNKVFVYRYGNKMYYTSDYLIRAASKYNGKKIKFITGDNSKICSKYDLPIDYIELSSNFTRIEMGTTKFYLNPDEATEICSKMKKIDGDPTAIPIGVDGDTAIYITAPPASHIIYKLMEYDEEFKTIVNGLSPASRYQYSKASILNTLIPVIVICGYLQGLEATIRDANIDYRFTETRPNKSDLINADMGFIKFNDGYLVYNSSYDSELLLNGLKECDTENYSLTETVKGSSMWLDFLDIFGGRLKADGLDNFNDLMIDSPITTRVCDKLGLPKTFIGALLHANMLLVDNKYNKHSDITGNRFRCAEIIAGYLYKCVAKSYSDYSNQFKKTGDGILTMKQSAVIDALLLDPTASDLSTLTPLLEAETANSVSFKGLSGMNSDRSYGLDKREYNSSMLNVLGMSTGFAGNVGINRQATIDKNITGSYGFIKPSGKDDMSITKTFTFTEAVVPMGSTRDDPTRVAMTFIQTAKHNMPTKIKTPMLMSSGADQAIAYMTTDTYAFKAKDNGVVVDMVENEYMIVEYNNKSREYIDLSNKVYKNSDGGFYIILKNITNLKKGSTFKKGQIIAYDENSFDGSVGPNDNLAYTSSTLTKVAIATTDDGFEDSCIITDWLSEALSSDVVVRVPISLDKTAILYNMVKKGDPVVEGDPLLIYQNSFEEEDANIILKNINSDQENAVLDIGKIPIKSKVTGIVQDIRVYRTVEKDELSPSLKKMVNSYEKEIKTKTDFLKKQGVEIPLDTPPTYTLPPTGKLKGTREGVMVEFFLLYHDKLSTGDKITYFSALKGVVKDIFPKGMEPYGEFRKEEKIHSFLSMSSINGRMVTSPINIAVVNKLMVELARSCKDIYGIKWEPLEDTIMKLED